MNEELERRSQCFDKIEREYDRYQRDMAKKCQ